MFIVGAIKLCVDEYVHNKKSPIQFEFESKEIVIDQVPFPTISLTRTKSFKTSEIDGTEKENLSANTFLTVRNYDSKKRQSAGISSHQCNRQLIKSRARSVEQLEYTGSSYFTLRNGSY
jgi:hypothetical protein